VLCDFGKNGTACVETDPVKTEASVVADLVSGEQDHPIKVVAFSVAEGWARDVSEDIARAVVDRARAEGRRLPEGTRGFVERHLDEDLAPALWL
jgi:hypothetical protein